MAYSTVPKVKRDGTIILADGGGNSLTVAYEEGNFTFDFAGDDEIVIRDRGVISCVRRGDEQPTGGSFSFYMRDFTDSEVGGVRDFITKQGAYSSNTSTGDSGVPKLDHYAITISLEIDSSLDGHTGTNSKVQLEKNVCKFSFSEGDPNTYNITFTTYGPISYTAGA